MKTIDILIPYDKNNQWEITIREISSTYPINKIYLCALEGVDYSSTAENVEVIKVESFYCTELILNIARVSKADYLLYYIKKTPLKICFNAIGKLLDYASDNGSVFLYSHRYKWVDMVRVEAPVIEYLFGSLRNDFDFGSLFLIDTVALRMFESQKPSPCLYSGFYQMLLGLSRLGNIAMIDEYLYEELEDDNRDSGVKQFDYVDPRQRVVQVEMEQVCTHHLKEIGGYLSPGNFSPLNLSQGDFPVEASVIIPVLNRANTICDAINSLLAQQCNFNFNILVVDNHSNDGTSQLIDSFDDKRVVHLVPRSRKLGIGGCWNYAVNHQLCGRFAVQLDSDDLYSSPHTLQRIVDEFYKQQCAMIIGSYRMCDFSLRELPPGVIDHREWTDDNGRNNALRINGLGAPRAFYTPIIRSIEFPNVSYGEDYAVVLHISRLYKIGRIYDVLYLCRRWEGNSDSLLPPQKVNAHNRYKDYIRTKELRARVRIVKESNKPCRKGVVHFFHKQLKLWPQMEQRFTQLSSVASRRLSSGIVVQYNPSRILSTAASVDAASIGARLCFLCAENRPKEQISITTLSNIEILVNPFPILPNHLTLSLLSHTPQMLEPLFPSMLALSRRWRGMSIFYNGAKCGASAPDHAHLQAVPSKLIPLWQMRKKVLSCMQSIYQFQEGSIYFLPNYVVPLFAIISGDDQTSTALLTTFLNSMPCFDGEVEPRLNVITCFDSSFKSNVTLLFPRSQHRPPCYNASGEEQRLISPGALDMASLVITPRLSDYDNLTNDEAVSILRSVSIDEALVKEVIQKITLHI